jgi:hypothetical protein
MLKVICTELQPAIPVCKWSRREVGIECLLGANGVDILVKKYTELGEGSESGCVGVAGGFRCRCVSLRIAVVWCRVREADFGNVVQDTTRPRGGVVNAL